MSASITQWKENRVCSIGVAGSISVRTKEKKLKDLIAYPGDCRNDIHELIMKKRYFHFNVAYDLEMDRNEVNISFRLLVILLNLSSYSIYKNVKWNPENTTILIFI